MRLFFFLLVLAPAIGYSQILQPARITASLSKTTIKTGDEAEIIFKAAIDPGWYIYTLGFDAECGPVPIAITVDKNSGYELVGDLRAINDKLKHDEIFDCDVRIFVSSGEFRQKIKFLSNDVTSVKGSYEGQVCSESEGKCILFDGSFTIDKLSITGESLIKKKTSSSQSIIPDQVKPVVDTTSQKEASVKTYSDKITGPVLDESLIQQSPQQKSFALFFILAFMAGLAALLTPCVFPMIPMTVSFFTGKQQSKFKALLYGFFIILIYTVIGAALAPLMGPETANHLSTEWIPNLIFFAVFIVFGLSFLGLFEINLPTSFVNKVDRQADKGGWIGVFFMAFTIVLVSFSCTGPIVGSILVSSAGGEFIKPIIGMLGFSLAFAIPFTLFAFFPGWLSTLPKSGGWLNSVKVVLGFLEIALAFKFLSIADQAFHWGVLDRDVNIAIWIVVGLLIGAYLMKWFALPGDTGKDAEDKRISIPRLSLAMLTFTFVMYLIPGMWGAPLKALAGYLPPLYTHDFNLLTSKQSEGGICDEPKYADFLHLPHGLKGYFDYKQALMCAREQGKPLFIDFTGHGCTNCREMEAVVWSDPQVLQRLQNDYVVVALYVDDKTELPENEWYTSAYDNKVKKTIGKQNADLQITNLNNNAQPFYVLVGNDEKVLVAPYGYDRTVENFVKFLDEGKSRFKAP
jgi:thiol:disulfide interchange protein